MAVSSRVVQASRAATFDVLSDGWLYSNWVVGTSHMRAVEADWPTVGCRLFHASGVWPMVTRDETEVVAVEPGRRLELIARGRPLGTAEIVIELADADGGRCLVTMAEQPVSGPGQWLHNPLTEATLARRNVEALDRLAALVERRTEPSE
jgi:uncharacterized protein YndB with AHSA1/START domain